LLSGDLSPPLCELNGSRDKSRPTKAATSRRTPHQMPTLRFQLIELFVLAIPVACISWTVTHEEVFREPRDYCVQRSKNCRRWYQRKFFYLLTCEYCLSHYVTAAFLVITRFKLLFDDWRGYLLALFSLVWIANQYISVYNRLRLDIKTEKLESEIKEEVVAANRKKE
jgi:hypothetical protein